MLSIIYSTALLVTFAATIAGAAFGLIDDRTVQVLLFVVATGAIPGAVVHEFTHENPDQN
jgi:hypothetical protein